MIRWFLHKLAIAEFFSAFLVKLSGLKVVQFGEWWGSKAAPRIKRHAGEPYANKGGEPSENRGSE